MGQAKLVMVLGQVTLRKIIIHDFNIYLDNELENAKTPKSILPEFHLSETWIYVKYKQFNFSLLVNGRSGERKVFPSIL